ncbi:docking protein 1-like [Ctenocephalides felis]|uniref:docking protein 1-like n=1 Tax=Ctenocephalides felis TaxID=7515 RepID=UPI000E6E5A8F|nr:docking protein 1-like [Ctenocephalides felis]
MEVEKPVMKGYLLFPPQGIVFNLTKKKIWTQKYCMLFKSSSHGIERLEIFDSIEDVNNTTPRIITLENCVKITKTAPLYFAIITKTIVHHIGVTLEDLLSPWVSAFQSVAFKEDILKNICIEEDNELYCTLFEDVFTVKLIPSEASERCGFESTLYMLYLTGNAIQLCDIKNGALIATWPYMYIRRYGYRGGKFTFEAGRKCFTGEGTFHLEHSNQQEIFRSLSTKMKSMKKLMSQECIVSLDCADSQFHAAMNMEARSRSPFPPSINYSTDMESPSNFKIKTFSEPADANLTSHKMLSSVNTASVQPQKPPRKFIFPNVTDKSDREVLSRHNPKEDKESTVKNVVSPIADSNKGSKYDKIMYRKNAWKTLGLDEVNHTETFNSSQQELLLSFKKRSKSYDNLNISSELSSNILTQLSDNKDSDNSYDRLQYFGSNNKLNRSFGYKSINNLKIKPPDSFVKVKDNGELLENIQPARLADDSHQGYGVIRKSPKAAPQVPVPQKPIIPQKPILNVSDVSHIQFNGTQYALVSKAKQV